MQLSTFLRSLRTRRKLTQRELARELDIAINTVQAWERAERPTVPNPFQIRDLARFYKISADQILKYLPETRAAAHR